MKRYLKITIIVFLSFSLIAIMHYCKKLTAPVVITVNVSGITQTTAVSGGNVTDDGGTEVKAYGVCWGNTRNPTTNSSKTSDGSGKGSYTSNITSLTANTKYYVRAYATNSEGTSYGNEVTFTTSQILLATLTTTIVTSITSSTIASGGNISDDGGADITARGVCWGTNANPTIADNKTSDVTGIETFSCTITGLSPGTLYHIRAYATNNIGTAYGDDLTFTTLAVIPTVTTAEVTSVTYNSATSGGNINSDGGAIITASGICWGTSSDPTVTGDHTTDGNGIGSFISNMKCLTDSTTYYVRAYATNSSGTAYGNQESFITKISQITFNPNLSYGSVSDIDGNCYKTIQIGTQTWMAENLKTTKYNNGDSIGTTFPDRLPLVNQVSPKYQWALGNRLYTWFAIMDNRKVCPSGWHVPTDEEWETLEMYLGMTQEEADAFGPRGTDQGSQLKSTTGWTFRPDGINGTNTSGFTGSPRGIRNWAGSYNGGTSEGHWWTASETANESNIIGAIARALNSSSIQVSKSTGTDGRMGLSVRCVKD